MDLESFELKQNIARMSDEELLKIVGADAPQYREDAINFAKSELARRGLQVDEQQSSIRCGKCDGAVEEGFIPDFGHYEYVRPLRWVEGTPERSFWSGTKIGDSRNVNIVAYRCTTCGLLEFYAAETSDGS